MKCILKVLIFFPVLLRYHMVLVQSVHHNNLTHTHSEMITTTSLMSIIKVLMLMAVTIIMFDWFFIFPLPSNIFSNLLSSVIIILVSHLKEHYLFTFYFPLIWSIPRHPVQEILVKMIYSFQDSRTTRQLHLVTKMFLQTAWWK